MTLSHHHTLLILYYQEYWKVDFEYVYYEGVNFGGRVEMEREAQLQGEDESDDEEEMEEGRTNNHAFYSSFIFFLTQNFTS